MSAGLFFCAIALAISGAAGLGYQIVWTRTLGVGLGHEIIALLAVVSAFFAGLALGAWALGGRVRSSAVPGRWYVGLEIAVGVWGLALLPILSWIVDRSPLWLGATPTLAQQLGVVFVLPALAFAPATVAMGATVPAMERLLTQSARARHIALIYGVNTFGALVGVLGFTFWAIPALGFRAATFALVSLSFGSAALGAVGARRLLRETRDEAPEHSDAQPSVATLGTVALGLALVTTGFLGIAYESLVVRVMSQVFEGAIYSFAAALSVYLLGTVLGAGAYQRWGRRTRDFARTQGWLALGTALTITAGIAALYGAFDLYRSLRLALGDTLPAVATAEFTMALPILLLPSAFMSALFCHLVQAAEDTGKGVGWGIAWNTLGSALAPAIAVLAVLPLVGAKWALVATALGYLGLVSWPSSSGAMRVAAAAALLLVAVLPPALRIVTLRDDEQVLAYREGALASVAVAEREEGRNLRVNNRFQMGGTTPDGIRVQRLQTHLPLLFHPNPKRALFLGVASGVTVGTALEHPDLRADAVELVPEALEMLPYFAPENRSEDYGERVRLFAADARRFARSSTDQYDVVIADLFHPGRDGSGFLYTREHFAAIEARLAEDGLFCQWLPLFQLDTPMLRAIIASFGEVFPWGFAVMADLDIRYPALGLIGRRGPGDFPPDYVRQRFSHPALAPVARSTLLHDERRLFGLMLLGPDDLKELAEDVSPNTDDHPHVLFEAPRFTYQRDVPSYRQLRWLLDRGSVDVEGALGSAPAAGETATGTRRAAEVRRYQEARDLYLRALIAEREEGWERALPLYEASVRASTAFTTSFAKLFAVGRAWMQTDPARGRALLEELAKARPGVPRLEALLREAPRRDAAGVP
ncbi:MAG: spermidine synthase [Myxococcota bacterium]